MFEKSTAQPQVARSQGAATRPRVLAVGYAPAGALPLRQFVGDRVRVEHERDLARALERCLREPIDLLFVNLFRCRPSELTALAMFRQARPGQYVAACADESFLEPLEQAGLADAFFKLERIEGP